MTGSIDPLPPEVLAGALQDTVHTERHATCAGCNGNRWRVFLVQYPDAKKPTAELRPCVECNPNGDHGIGITMNEEKFRGGSRDYHLGVWVRVPLRPKPVREDPLPGDSPGAEPEK